MLHRRPIRLDNGPGSVRTMGTRCFSDICKGSPRNADHCGMFLNSLFLGVWVSEEAVYGVRVVEELDGCIGAVRCGRIVAEDGAGATGG